MHANQTHCTTITTNPNPYTHNHPRSCQQHNSPRGAVAPGRSSTTTPPLLRTFHHPCCSCQRSRAAHYCISNVWRGAAPQAHRRRSGTCSLQGGTLQQHSIIPLMLLRPLLLLPRLLLL
jgi:hypothetical protein